jgi:hypothetical protein
MPVFFTLVSIGYLMVRQTTLSDEPEGVLVLTLNELGTELDRPIERGIDHGVNPSPESVPCLQ